MSKFITAASKAGLALRLCWRSGSIESVVLEDAGPKTPGQRHSDGVHVRLNVQVIPASRWDRFDEAPHLKAIENAKASGVQSRLDKAMKELAASVKALAADEDVLVVDSASAWATSRYPVSHYATLLRAQRRTPKSLIGELQDQADASKVCFRVKDWTKLENELLVALGFKPLRTRKKAEDAEEPEELNEDEFLELDDGFGD